MGNGGNSIRSVVFEDCDLGDWGDWSLSEETGGGAERRTEFNERGSGGPQLEVGWGFGGSGDCFGGGSYGIERRPRQYPKRNVKRVVPFWEGVGGRATIILKNLQILSWVLGGLGCGGV